MQTGKQRKLNRKPTVSFNRRIDMFCLDKMSKELNERIFSSFLGDSKNKKRKIKKGYRVPPGNAYAAFGVENLFQGHDS